jgi:hypothetical protein
MYIQHAESINEFVFASMTITPPVADDDEAYLNDYAKFELEFKRRKQIHDEYLQKKEAYEIKDRIEFQERLEKDRKNSWKYSDSSASEKEEVNVVRGEVAPFAYLISQIPYDFQQYVPLDPHESQKTREKLTIWMSDDHVPVGEGIADKYVFNRLAFKGEKAEVGDSLFKKAKDELTTHKHMLQETIKQVLRGFWADVAQHLRLTYGKEGKLVDSWVKFQNCIRSVTTRQEAKIVCMILYLSLNFVFSFRDQIATAVLTFCKYKILKEPKRVNVSPSGRKTRQKRSFVKKLISQMMTDLRKGINGDAELHTGFTYTKQNPDGGDDTRAKDKHSHLKFYDWMVMGSYVSIYLTKIMRFGNFLFLTYIFPHIYYLKNEEW